MSDLPQRPLLPDALVQRTLKNLRNFLRTTKDQSPRAIVSFLKNKFRFSDEQIKYFIYRANQLLYQTGAEDWKKKQQKSAAFQKLPAWAKWGLSYAGYNPTDTAQLR